MKNKIILDIDGMHCASCAVNIERSLRKISGVIDVNVNLIAKKGYIKADRKIGDNILKTAVARVGNYKVSSINKEEEYKIGHEKMHQHSIEQKEHSHAMAEESEMEMWKKRMIGAWIFAVPIAIIMIADRVFGISIFSYMTITSILLALGFPVLFYFGFHTLRGGLKGFTNLYFNMDSLIALGTVIAYITGIASFFTSIQDYSGVASMIMAFFLTGKYIESKARGKAGEEIKKLLELGAKKAIVLRGKDEIEIEISNIKLGDIMIVKPGEKIPTDGAVVKGESAVDESMISGESMPVDKTNGSNVIGATINQDGILYVKATKIGKDTFLSHIIKLVEEAQGSKIPIQEFADKITNIFVPVVLAISVITFIAWLFFTGDLSSSIAIAVSVLVIACPCALGLATPTALMVGSGMGAQRGILFRKGEAIQTMKSVKTIVFDKTGTITEGKPKVTDIVPVDVSKKYLLQIAASIEKLSGHPIAHAIINEAEKNKISLISVQNFNVQRGRGITGIMRKKKFLIGNRTLMKENNIHVDEINSKIDRLENQGKTVLIVSENSNIIGVLAVADTLKSDSVEAIRQLHSDGYKTLLITGDNEKTARAIAQQAGIDDVMANVLPEDKAKKVEELQREGMVAFVGDGINDAPALKQSNVGIAMGTGTDIAIESGDIVLAKGSLIGVVQAIRLSKATFRKIKQNLFWAFAYNTIAIPIAIAGLLHPIIAEIAMALSSVTVVGNANLLRRERI